MPRIKDVYIIPSGSKAYPNSNISSNAYNNLLEDLAFDNNNPRPIASGGTAATNIVQARINLGCDDAKNIVKGNISEKVLPFQPVQQGGGNKQKNNKIYIGWDGSNVILQVDSKEMGGIWTSESAPKALVNLLSCAEKANNIVYTASPNTYAASYLSPYMRGLLACANIQMLHQAIFEHGFIVYKDKTKIIEFTGDGDIISNKHPKTMWQSIDDLQNAAKKATDDIKNCIKKTNVTNMERLNGYIHFDTTTGAVGCSYFLSDESIKEIHGPSNVRALDFFDKIDFIDFNYLPASGMDPTLRHEIGFSANNLQKVNPTFVDKIGDYLSPNSSIIITYLARAVQELSKEVKELRGMINQNKV